MVGPDANRFRRGACSKQSCRFSTLARSGTCCRKAIRTTKPCIVGFSLGATAKFCVRVLTDVPNELRDKGVLDEEESFIDATFAMAKGGNAGNRSNQAWKRHENHGDRGSPCVAAVGEYARRKSS